MLQLGTTATQSPVQFSQAPNVSETTVSLRSSVLLNWGKYKTRQNYLLNKVTSVSVLPRGTLRKTRSLRIPKSSFILNPIGNKPLPALRPAEPQLQFLNPRGAHAAAKHKPNYEIHDLSRRWRQHTPPTYTRSAQPLTLGRGGGGERSPPPGRGVAGAWPPHPHRAGEGSGAPPAGAARNQAPARGKRRRRNGERSERLEGCRPACRRPAWEPRFCKKSDEICYDGFLKSTNSLCAITSGAGKGTRARVTSAAVEMI